MYGLACNSVAHIFAGMELPGGLMNKDRVKDEFNFKGSQSQMIEILCF